MSNLINRQDVIDAICTWDKFGVDERGRVVRWYEGLEPYVHLRDVVFAIEKLPSAEPEIHEISYSECANAMMKMWIDKVLTDGEYNRIMDKLNVYWAERRTDG